MPAETAGFARSASRSVLDQRRQGERRACSIAVTIRTGGSDFAARLINLSAGGLGVQVDTLVPLKPGAQLLLIHAELGHVPCLLRWASHPRYGAEFQAGHPASARIRALYDRLPPDSGEIA